MLHIIVTLKPVPEAYQNPDLFRVTVAVHDCTTGASYAPNVHIKAHDVDITAHGYDTRAMAHAYANQAVRIFNVSQPRNSAQLPPLPLSIIGMAYHFYSVKMPDTL